MLELNLYRKNKVNLEDYDYQTDIKNRVMMARFTETDVTVLEEILYSPIKFPIKRLLEDLELSEEEGMASISKLSETGLFRIKGDQIEVSKEMRKYFEAQMQKFDEDFQPGMEFLQSLLKKVPIHVLPIWYPIPRTSNNIFDSLVEKYLLTPQTFQRYLTELHFTDETMMRIIDDVFESPNLEIESSVIMEKYDLSQEAFEELMLHLEFNFVCCLVYRKSKGKCLEIVTPFYEWKQYLTFIKDSSSKTITEEVVPLRTDELAFAKDLSALLTMLNEAPLSLRLQDERWIFEKTELPKITEELSPIDVSREDCPSYLSTLIHKLLFLKLARVENSKLIGSEEGVSDYLSMPIEKRSLNTYKHTIIHYPYNEFPQYISTERNIHEIEKTLGRAIGRDWIYFDEFLAGLIVSISDDSKVTLKKKGRTWQYTLPSYTDDEKRFIEMIIMDWLFEAGLVMRGVVNQRRCFKVTTLGESLFSS
ncbi:MAG: hypothetical protein SP1CHLAM54_06810 [Chlamydiia bacterium]|nr:hypothetical protein [Chlamydiia bacterium]MCH9615589.1 hypothetical protein [Chlamydiia bacterium]MCH9629244.1 hypothetical protein [Chlamydiia bacterium]